MKQTWVIKVGGELLNSAFEAKALFSALKSIEQHQFILVHGGGSLVDLWLKDAGFISKKHQGLRISPSEQMPYIVGALAGCANKQLTGWAIEAGVKPVGLTLFEAGVQCTVKSKALGHVGQCETSNATFLQSLLNNESLPIVSSIGFDAKGCWLNVNADEAAAAIAKACDAELIYLTDVAAVLDQQGDPIDSLDAEQIEQLITQQVIKAGMRVKTLTALNAAQTIKRGVYITSWNQPDNLQRLAAGKHTGTLIKP